MVDQKKVGEPTTDYLGPKGLARVLESFKQGEVFFFGPGFLGLQILTKKYGERAKVADIIATEKKQPPSSGK